jgi:Fanconi anemia group J protein
MMDRIIRALNGTGQHALLESPTGSGKTMALLCAVLAWVTEQKKKNPALERGLFALAESGQDGSDGNDPLQGSPFTAACKSPPLNPNDEMDNDFIAFDDLKQATAPKSCESCPSKVKTLQAEKSVSLPKIYFTSRTHKQLAQVIRELKRSGYTSKFTVLASRSHYCVNTAVRESKDVNEACREALAPKPPAGRCMYANSITKFINRNAPFSTNMDVEELVDYGKTFQLCPYYLAREGAESAEIIMCPYNYIVDPSKKTPYPSNSPSLTFFV